MKSIIVGVVIALLLASPLIAKDLNITGCTADHQKAVLTIDINSSAPADIVDEIINAYVKTAKSLSADELINGSGFRIFIGNLTEDDYDAINGIQGPPILDGSCS